jgi:hypothetical protein
MATNLLRFVFVCRVYRCLTVVSVVCVARSLHVTKIPFFVYSHRAKRIFPTFEEIPPLVG